MSARIVIGVLILAAATLSGPAFAEEPTLHQVYQAAESGNFAQAQRMMDEVLRAHPNSAKAHFVEAELLAKQGRSAAAAAELNTAERLEPGLPFAKPQAVQELKGLIASSRGIASSAAHSAVPAAGGGIPWGMLLLGAGVVAIVFVVVRAMRQRSATLAQANSVPAYGSSTPVQPSSNVTAAPAGPVGGGIGSGILGGLATGAAVGAGVVAGEALAHRFMDGHRSEGGTAPPVGSDAPQSLPGDMGGNDFGVSDGSSWDDGFIGGGGSDWS